MIYIAYWVRILALLTVATVMIAYDRRKGSVVRQWEYGCIFFAGLLGAAYGAANDAITVSISPAYFTIGKGLELGGTLHSEAVQLGAAAGFSGAAIAAAIWLFALRKRRVPERCLLIASHAWIPLAGALSLSAVGGALISFRFDPLDFSEQLSDMLRENQIDAFLTVWWVHIGAYLGLTLGLAAGIMLTRRGQERQNQAMHGTACRRR